MVLVCVLIAVCLVGALSFVNIINNEANHTITVSNGGSNEKSSGETKPQTTSPTPSSPAPTKSTNSQKNVTSTNNTPPQPSASPPGNPGLPPKTVPSHNWIMGYNAFNSIIADPTAAARLKNDVIYLISGSPVIGYNIIPTIDVKDVTKMSAAISKRAAYVKAVLYDDEDWSYTPVNQIDSVPDVTASYQQASQLTHNAGLKLIGTPALDITNILKPTGSCGTESWQKYLCDDLPGIAGQYSDIIDIQAQSQIQNSSNFISLIQLASAAAKSFNPNITILAGISTCAGSPTASQLANGAIESNPYVSGWWMNVPGQSVGSPNCGTPLPDIAIQAIDSLPWY
jgi:hypothetical protein